MPSGKVITLLGSVPGVSHVLRWAARHYPEGSVVRIRHGVAAGMHWKRHHRYVNGYWIGHYELGIQSALERELKPGDTFYDVGANAGFFSLVGARCVGPTGRVIAFEPSPDNISSIEEQVQLNRLESSVQWAKVALGDLEGQAGFAFSSPGSPTGHLGEPSTKERAIMVKVTTVDAVVNRFGAPNFIKVDVEGFETKVLQGARTTLQKIKPLWLLEIHGAEQGAQVREILTRFGYGFYEINGARITGGGALPHHVVARPNN